jgi:tRNA-binding EMAP/Myf-like protein
MRNAALGESLVRCFEQVGHPVVAANYFGDEGQHIATCLWQLQREAKQKGTDVRTLLDTVPETERGEWLGGFYARGVEALALDGLTSLPYSGVVAAQVKSKGPHPSSDAPANWHLVEVVHGDKTATVVCGGAGYNIGDIVAYVPVGAIFDGKLVGPMDKGGVLSHGIILAKRELGVCTLLLHIGMLDAYLSLMINNA